MNQFYLDWFDVTYERALVAVNGQLRFDVLPADAAPSARFRVAGLPSGDVLVMDLSLGRRLMPDSTTSDGGGTFTVVFSDTITVPRSYFVATRAVDRLPQSLGAKQFADLRSSTGADYLVISHPLFLSAATALAAERASSLSLRTKVIDVTDIYDEFNYGVLNPIAIKRFLRYAYQHWPTPSPSNVVFFGDASWDPHHYMANTINADFIPAFGVPSSDNWYACFDSATPWVPSLFLGRLPVQTITEANQVVSKITTFDTTPKSEWVKKFLFMTGGSDSGEWADFDAKSDYMISTYIDPSPVGGKSIRAYKMSPGYIDGSMKPQLQAIFADGIEFVSFIGHSGGRIWGLDPGSPYDFQNTNGWWPFVASVSCNVGAFAEPTGGVLAEDFLLADHRGGVGVWASASLGYPTHGTLLVDYFLDFMRNGARSVGELTTVSRIRLWQSLGSDYITIAHQYLTPLIGDPATRLPLPLNPDLALESSDLSIDPSQPTTSDSTVSVAVHVKNFGLVPAAPAELNINDTYKGVSSAVAQNLSIAPVYFVDSLSVPWHPRGRPGQHTLSFSVTLPDSIQEYSTTNNTLTYDRYIYANSLQALRPMNGQMVAPGPVRLVVSAPEGVLSGGTTYAFELDSVSTFDSPFHIASPQVNPLGASGEWTTPALPTGIDVYWRARTVSSSSTSPW
ncbi:MAG: C25 family cysteine peptidase, partial [Bacteroidota bacterium]